jgi:hypothetical protein
MKKSWEAKTCIGNNMEAVDALAISLEETSEEGNDSDDGQSQLNTYFEYCLQIWINAAIHCS